MKAGTYTLLSLLALAAAIYGTLNQWGDVSSLIILGVVWSSTSSILTTINRNK
jgi:hypothetical protein